MYPKEDLHLLDLRVIIVPNAYHSEINEQGHIVPGRSKFYCVPCGCWVNQIWCPLCELNRQQVKDR